MLAAVAILGIWYSVLASVAIQGLRSEGVNERRMRASLIADRTLADIELALDAQEFTFENLDPVEDEEFTVWVDVVPLTQMEFAELDPSLLALFEGDLASLTSVLYTIQVRVVWLEGAGEEQVTRTTYAWDPTVLNEALDRGAGTGTGTGTGTGEETPLEPPPQEQP